MQVFVREAPQKSQRGVPGFCEQHGQSWRTMLNTAGRNLATREGLTGLRAWSLGGIPQRIQK